MRKIKIIATAGIFLSLFNFICYAGDISNKVTFKLVLSVDTVQQLLREDQGNKKNYDEVHSNNEVIYVEKIPRLSQKDIAKAIIRKQETLFNGETGNNLDTIVFNFTEDGTGKLFNLTKEFIGRRLAIFVGDEFISAPKIIEPISGGSLELSIGDYSVEEFGELLKKNGIVTEYEKVACTDQDKQK